MEIIKKDMTIKLCGHMDDKTFFELRSLIEVSLADCLFNIFNQLSKNQLRNQLDNELMDLLFIDKMKWK